MPSSKFKYEGGGSEGQTCPSVLLAKVAADNAAEGVRKLNLAEYFEKGIVK